MTMFGSFLYTRVAIKIAKMSANIAEAPRSSPISIITVEEMLPMSVVITAIITPSRSSLPKPKAIILFACLRVSFLVSTISSILPYSLH